VLRDYVTSQEEGAKDMKVRTIFAVTVMATAAMPVLAQQPQRWRDLVGVTNTSFVETNGDRAIQLSIDAPAPGKAAMATPSTLATMACSAPESRQMDFWLGEWSVDWRRSTGEHGRAHNSVTREADGCVIAERFEDPSTGLRGIGIYSYFPLAHRWTQTWMDNSGITINASGGPSASTPDGFFFDLARGQDPGRKYRFAFSEITHDRFVWRFQSCAPDAMTWSDETVSNYERIRPLSPRTASFHPRR